MALFIATVATGTPLGICIDKVNKFFSTKLKYSFQFNLVVPFDLGTNIKKMRGSPKIIDPCAILGILKY